MAESIIRTHKGVFGVGQIAPFYLQWEKAIFRLITFLRQTFRHVIWQHL
jgi:hypothetical protein